MRVLLAEDDIGLADITAQNLKKDGFAVDTAYSGEEALCLMESEQSYDAVILDLNLPDVDGIEILKDLKSKMPHVPALALTARDAEEDRIRGLQAGFNDYMAKPFSYHELAARLRVLYRSQNSGTAEIIKIGPLQINPQSQATFIDGVPIKLTLNEFRALHYLVKNRNRSVPKKELLTSVWDNNDNSGTAKVITTVSRLRKKIGDCHNKIIRTAEGGYIIDY